MGLCASVAVSEEGYGDMVFAKRLWLYASVLVVLLCVALGVFLVWHANQPVEPKTVYLMPEPNPKRAEILKQALQPPKHVYATTTFNEETTTGNATVESPEATRGESLSEESEFEDADLESMLGAIDEENAEQNSDFPPVPEGFPADIVPVWLGIPGYQKGDMPEHESISRVLIKLWNQGERGFIDGAFAQTEGKVYPIYPDVMYVRWDDEMIDDEDGNVITFRMIVSSLGSQTSPFDIDDFITGEWKDKYPGIKFVDYADAGYYPDTFLAEED